MKQREKFECKNCDGEVYYKNGLGWCHIVGTGCIKPAVSKDNWHLYLKLKKSKTLKG